MSSTFTGVETALRGVLAHQQAINTVAHNVANASTPGYSRQDPVFAATNAIPSPSVPGYPEGGPFGTGVQIGSIRRLHDEWLAGRMRSTESTYGYWETQGEYTDRIQTIVDQSGSSGLDSLMNRFWNAWQQLTQSPDDTGVRAAVVSEGRNLAEGLNSINADLQQLLTDSRAELVDAVARVNEITKGLADLNAQVRAVAGLGGTPNDLYDQRDRLLAELSSYADVDVYQSDNGAVTVTMGNRQLVEGTSVGILQVPLGSPAQVQWSDGVAASINQGKIAALTEIENSTVSSHLTDLTALRDTIINGVNDLHTTGFDLDGNVGLPFFEITGSTVSVSATFDDPRRLAISADGSIGNADIARAIAGLADTPQLSLGQISVREHFSAWVSRAGSEAREMQDMADRTKARRDSVNAEQESVSGVNLDEEAAHLVQWQRAFSASARVLTVMDELLGTVIERLGVGGR